MVFKKGDININREGRPKLKNTLPDHIQRLLRGSVNRLNSNYKTLSTTQHIKLLAILLPYVLPKMQTVEHESEEETLTFDDVNELVNKLLDKNERRDIHKEESSTQNENN